MRKEKLEQFRAAVREQQDFLNTTVKERKAADPAYDFNTDEAYQKRAKTITELKTWLDADTELEQHERAYDHSAQTRSSGRGNASGDAKESETRNFVNYIATGDTNLLMQSRANMASNGTTTGGYLVPTFVSSQVIQDLSAFESVRKAGAQVVQVSGNENIPIFQDANANFIAEAQSITATDPTVSRIQITPNLLVCKTTYSWQLANRSGANVVDQIRASFVRGIAKTEAAKFLYGTGSGMPQGLIYGGSTTTTTASATTFTGPELIAPYYAMNPVLAANGTWFMSPGAAQIARSLESTNGRPLWYTNLVDGSETLLGRPVIIDANMDAVTASKNPVAFANVPEAYVIGEEVDLKVVSDPYSAAGTGEIRLYVYKFVDGKVKNAAAVYKMVTHA